MKKYLLFGGSNYYPEGGAKDFISDFDTVSDAKVFTDKNRIKFYKGMQAFEIENDDDINFALEVLDGWAQVVDRDTMDIVSKANVKGHELIVWNDRA